MTSMESSSGTSGGYPSQNELSKLDNRLRRQLLPNRLVQITELQSGGARSVDQMLWGFFQKDLTECGRGHTLTETRIVVDPLASCHLDVPSGPAGTTPRRTYCS